jgi:hypothetical protein
VFEGNSEKAAENCEIITIQDLLQLKGRQLCLGATVNKAAENCEIITIQDLPSSKAVSHVGDNGAKSSWESRKGTIITVTLSSSHSKAISGVGGNNK